MERVIGTLQNFEVLEVLEKNESGPEDGGRCGRSTSEGVVRRGGEMGEKEEGDDQRSTNTRGRRRRRRRKRKIERCGTEVVVVAVVVV